jgi:hypothetical protein
VRTDIRVNDVCILQQFPVSHWRCSWVA